MRWSPGNAGGFRNHSEGLAIFLGGVVLPPPLLVPAATPPAIPPATATPPATASAVVDVTALVAAAVVAAAVVVVAAAAAKGLGASGAKPQTTRVLYMADAFWSFAVYGARGAPGSRGDLAALVASGDPCLRPRARRASFGFAACAARKGGSRSDGHISDTFLVPIRNVRSVTFIRLDWLGSWHRQE